MKVKSIEVIGLGASTVDIISLVDHFPKGKEVQEVIAMVVQGGGPVSTAMVTLSRLGAKSGMIDTIGDDWRGMLIREEFQREGVDIDYVEVSQGCVSATSCIMVTRSDGVRAIMFSPGSVKELSLTNTHRTAIESAKYLHVSGRHWEACMQAVRFARAAGVQVSFDGGADRYRSILRELVPLTDVCIVARDFAEKYTGVQELPKAAELIEKCGPKLVVITDGIRGSYIHSREGQTFYQPAYIFHEVVDTTGCGDSYHGAFLFGLLRGYGLEKTASLASATAALNSQRLGGRSGLPNLKEVETFLLGARP
jgi:sugar/nucleoside kinase (ribokinase family)